MLVDGEGEEGVCVCKGYNVYVHPPDHTVWVLRGGEGMGRARG
jgi:hypothetical protein